MQIGQIIKSIRESKGIKQGVLAEVCNISQTYLSLIEKNKKQPNMDTLKSICDSLGVPLPFIMLYSVEESDISDEKLEIFQRLQLPIKNLLEKAIKLQKNQFK